jgi:hypothetical protein
MTTTPYRQVCDICGEPGTTEVSVPVDAMPYTDVHIEESVEFTPRERRDMTVCAAHHAELTEIVTCARCDQTLPAVDTITNAHTHLCRPCNARENR